MPESGGRPRLWSVRSYRLLWTSNLFGDVASAFGSLALSVTAVAVLHASALQVATIAAMGNGAYLFLGIPAGVLADRVPAKRLLVAADLLRVVAVGSVPVAFGLHVLTVVQLMTVAAATSCATVAFDVAHTTVLPTIVGRDRVSAASARLQTVDSSVTVIGPGLAGAVIARTAGPAAYVVTAAAHLLSAISAAAIRPVSAARGSSARPPFLQSFRDGLAYVLSAPLQRTFMLAGATVNLGAGFLGAMQALFVLRTLHLTTGEYGLALSIGGLGGVLGALLGMRIRAALGEIRTQIVAYALIPFAVAPMPLAPLLPVPHVVAISAEEFLVSFVIVVAAISSSGIYARITPPDKLGRVTAARRTVSVGVIPLGSLVAGAIAPLIGFDATIWIGTLLMTASVAVFAASPVFRHRDLPAAWEHSESSLTV